MLRNWKKITWIKPNFETCLFSSCCEIKITAITKNSTGYSSPISSIPLTNRPACMRNAIDLASQISSRILIVPRIPTILWDAPVVESRSNNISFLSALQSARSIIWASLLISCSRICARWLAWLPFSVSFFQSSQSVPILMLLTTS